MKIVAITNSRVPAPTANSIQALKASQALVQGGHLLTLLAFAPLPEYRGEDLRRFYGLQQSLDVRTLETPRRLFPYLALLQAVRLHPDLIYTWVPQVAALALLLGKPVVFEVHIQPSGRFGPFWHRLFARLPGRKRLACITRALYLLLQRRYRVALPPEQVVIAPNGVDLERFRDLPRPTAARAKLGLPERPTALCSGHLYAGRGAELFLDLAAEFPQVHFLWVGGRPQEVDYWRGRQAERRLTNVTFHGFVPNQDLPLYQAAADILLMPYERSVGVSSGEMDTATIASPMKLFEYLASGRPIVASDLAVLHEVLDEETALFCPPEEIAAWREAIGRLLADEALRLRLGMAAQHRAEAYTWEKRAQRILAGLER